MPDPRTEVCRKLRLANVVLCDPSGNIGQAKVFEVADGLMAGTRITIWDLQSEVAWRYGFAHVSRTSR